MSADPRITDTRSHRGKWFWLVAGFAGIGLLGVAFWWIGNDAGKVNGVPFRIWVAQHPDFQSDAPLAAVGTNAIPGFLSIISEPPESPRVLAAKAWIWSRLPRRWQSRFPRWYPTPQVQLKRTALFGLRSLGPEAKAALPELLRVGRAETNRMLRAGALMAALAIAPESTETFAFWRREWESTNYSRNELVIYLRSARYPIVAATPLLLEEIKRTPDPVAILEAFEFFGESARPVMPHMLAVFRDGTYRGSGNLVELFRRLGPVAAEAVPDLAARLDMEQPVRVLEALKSIGPQAVSALPKIQPLHTNADQTIRMLAVSVSAGLEGKPEVALPILLDCLPQRPRGPSRAGMSVEIRQPLEGLVATGPDAAAILLGELGSAASAALPVLEEKLRDKNRHTRVCNAQAIWRISGRADKALPVLIDILESQPQPNGGAGSPEPYLLIRTIEAIEELGPAAQPATPSLKRVRTFSMMARHAVDAALAKIEAKP